jgi:aminopeptidase N
LEKGAQLFESWSKDGVAINPDLRAVVYRAGIKSDPANAYGILKKEWETTASHDGKEVCLRALGNFVDVDIINNNVLPFLFNLSPPALDSDSVPSVNMHVLGSTVSLNRVSRPLLWKYMQENWDQATKKMANPIVLDRFIKFTLNKFNDAKYIDEIDAFFKDKDTASFDRTLEQVKDKVRGRAAYRERDAASLKEWLGANGYIS